MSVLKILSDEYSQYDDLGPNKLQALRNALSNVKPEEVNSFEDGITFIELLNRFRVTVNENNKLNGKNYTALLNSLLSVGEDGLYSNSLRFIFELIQNVDDCVFQDSEDCKLDIQFDFNNDLIILRYNEVGFTPFNVFAITGIAEAAKNISEGTNEIGEKGIGFKSVFGVAEKVQIRSGWFSFALYKEEFTIPVACYDKKEFLSGTEMTLYVPGKAQAIYRQIKEQYCRKEALFASNPLLFLNKLTSLRLYNDSWRSMEFKVSRSSISHSTDITREDNVCISVNLRDHDNGMDKETVDSINCTRYTYLVNYSYQACKSRYGNDTLVGSNGGKMMKLQAVVPSIENVEKVGKGALYSFLPTKLSFSVPIVCHAPFKLDASREFVDPQDKETPGGNLWFTETQGIYLAWWITYIWTGVKLHRIILCIIYLHVEKVYLKTKMVRKSVLSNKIHLEVRTIWIYLYS